MQQTTVNLTNLNSTNPTPADKAQEHAQKSGHFFRKTITPVLTATLLSVTISPPVPIFGHGILFLKAWGFTAKGLSAILPLFIKSAATVGFISTSFFPALAASLIGLALLWGAWYAGRAIYHSYKAHHA